MHATLTDVLTDTAQNSIEAGARQIEVEIVEDGSFFSVKIADNGKGMDEATRQRAFDPFFTEAGKHDKRKVGLGLPMLKQLCEMCGGGVSLESEKGVGTKLCYKFDAKNIDLPPIGDIPSAMLTLFNYPGDFELTFTHRTTKGEYSVSRNELADAVGGLDSVEGLSLAREFLESQEAEL